MCMGVESSTGTHIFTRIAMKKPIFTLKATAKGLEEDADNFPTNMSLKGKNYSIFFQSVSKQNRSNITMLRNTSVGEHDQILRRN